MSNKYRVLLEEGNYIIVDSNTWVNILPLNQFYKNLADAESTVEVMQFAYNAGYAQAKEDVLKYLFK